MLANLSFDVLTKICFNRSCNLRELVSVPRQTQTWPKLENIYGMFWVIASPNRNDSTNLKAKSRATAQERNKVNITGMVTRRFQNNT